MSVTSGQSVTVTFTTRHPVTGMGTDADFAPSGIVNVNGLANAATVTVTNLGTGEYKAAVTLPSLSIGDGVDLRISATVGGVADKAIVWRERCDATVNSRSTYAGGAVASITDVSNIVAGGPIVVVNNMVQSDVQMVLQSANAALGLQMVGDKFKADEEFDVHVLSMAANTLTASALASDAASEIATAVRDISNATPATGSLGENVQQAMIVAAEASGYSQNIIAKLGAFTGSGINTVLGFFKALLRSDATAPSDVGGTFTPSTDSVEALATNLQVVDDNVDAIKLVTVKMDSMLVQDGMVWQFTANSLELGPTDFTVSPSDITSIVTQTIAGVVSGLTGETLTYTGSITPAGDAIIDQGGSYVGDNALEWTGTWTGPDIDGATATLYLVDIETYRIKGLAAASVLDVDAVIELTGSALTVTAELTSAQTATLFGSYDSEITHKAIVFAQTVDSSGDEQVVALRGNVTVNRGAV